MTNPDMSGSNRCTYFDEALEFSSLLQTEVPGGDTHAQSSLPRAIDTQHERVHAWVGSGSLLFGVEHSHNRLEGDLYGRQDPALLCLSKSCREHVRECCFFMSPNCLLSMWISGACLWAVRRVHVAFTAADGRAVAQAVSRRLPNAAARIQAQARSCESCGGQIGTAIGFPRVLRFPLPRIPPTAPHSSSSSSIIWGWFSRPISGRRAKRTQSHCNPRNFFFNSLLAIRVT
jgi:hypothetical protein